MDFLRKLRQNSKHGLVLFSISNRLSKIGLKINPYYFVREYLPDEFDLRMKSQFDPYVVDLLEPPDIKTILTHHENKHIGERQIKKWLAYDCKCFGIKYKGDIASYTWYNLRECHELIPPLKLRDDEAYLFGAQTFKAYRGKNLAPYLRHQLYRHLIQRGRTKFYSITEFFNTPALKFKEKLKARPLKLYLYVGFFKKYHWNILLKRYSYRTEYTSSWRKNRR